MTDDPNAEPGDETEELDNTQELDDAQLEAAASGAEDDIEGEDEERDETIVDDLGGVEAAPAMPGGPRLEPEVRGPRVRGPKTTRTPFAIDPALRIKDPWSAWFVGLAVAVFGLILANALLFGHGGAFSPVPTPTAVPTEGPTESPSEAPTVVPSASPSVAPTTAPSTAPSVAPTTGPSVAPSAAPSPGAS